MSPLIGMRRSDDRGDPPSAASASIEARSAQIRSIHRRLGRNRANTRRRSSRLSNSATRCGPSAPLAPVTSTARVMSMLQQQSTPAGPEAVGEEQQARASPDPSAATEVLQVDETVGDDRVTEGWRPLMKPVLRYANQTQQDLPTGPTHPGRNDNVDVAWSQ